MEGSMEGSMEESMEGVMKEWESELDLCDRWIFEGHTQENFDSSYETCQNPCSLSPLTSLC